MFSFYKFNTNNFKRGMFGCFYSRSVFIFFLLICDFFCCCGMTTYKIIVIGDDGVGKTTLINARFNSKDDANTYIPINAQEKTTYYYPAENPMYKFEVWDTCANEKLEAANKIFFKDADGIIAMYDRTNGGSFNNLDYKIVEALSKAKENKINKKIPVLVVGYNSDDYENEVVSDEEGKEFANEKKYLFLAACETDYESVDSVFKTIAEKIIEANVEAPKKTNTEQLSKEKNNDSILGDDTDVDNTKKTRWCCDMCKNVN